MKQDSQLTIYLALIFAIITWGLSFVATKVALQSFPPFCLIFLRFSGASLIFLLLLWKTGFPILRGGHFKSLFFLSLLQPGLYFFFETFGLKYTSATKTSLIIATIPVVVLLLSTLLYREKTRWINLLGITLSLVGVCLLVFGGQNPAEMVTTILGDLLIVGAVFAASFYMIMTRKLGESLSSLQITGMQIIFGALLFFPAFLVDLPNLELQAVSYQSLLALICLTIFATVGAFLCYNFALTRIAAARAAVFINGIPVVTALGGWLLLGETLSSLQLTGGAVVLLAVILANRPMPRPQRAG